MNRRAVLVSILLAFVVGATVGIVLAKKESIAPALYENKAPAEAAKALLELARDKAGDGSWENIHLARVHYLAGEKDKAEEILSRVLGSSKVEPGDQIRAARAYVEAGEWDKAKELFDLVVEAAPKDEDWLAEAGAYYNLHGDRARAEELFGRSFALGASLNNTLNIAGSYVGVPPRKR